MTRHDAAIAAVPPDPDADHVLGPPETETGGILTVDLAAIEANWRLLASRATPAECAAVVKADAYGCGLKPVVARLSRAGCKTYFVADLSEARQLRAVDGSAIIYVLAGVLPGGAAGFAEINARPVINSLSELAEWDAFAGAQQWRGGAALHVDTGMNRLGVSPQEAAALAQRVQQDQAHGIVLLMSHFACAEQPSHPLNDRQVQVFRDLRTQFRLVPSSLANSAGIFLGPFAHCDLVRPGYALYGGNPTPGSSNPMQPVIELAGRILRSRAIDKGASVGYGATWVAKRATRLAVVAIGYGDGFLRAASGSGERKGGRVLIGDKLCPIVGRISMDLMVVDVTDVPETLTRRGDTAVLVGGALDIDNVGAAAGTIGYEILTALGRRYRRVYKNR